MLWPRDAEKRAEAKRTGAAIYVTEKTRHIELTPTEASELLRFGLEATAPSAIYKQSEKPFEHGFSAGLLLVAAVSDFQHFGGVKLEALKTEMTAASPWFSRSTLENAIWGDFKSVAHLWGAYVFTGLREGDSTFPCHLDRFPEFLGLARFLAEMGAKITPPRRNEPVLDPDRLWLIPEGLVLPPFAFDRPADCSKGA